MICDLLIKIYVRICQTFSVVSSKKLALIISSSASSTIGNDAVNILETHLIISEMELDSDWLLTMMALPWSSATTMILNIDSKLVSISMTIASRPTASLRSKTVEFLVKPSTTLPLLVELTIFTSSNNGPAKNNGESGNQSMDWWINGRLRRDWFTLDGGEMRMNGQQLQELSQDKILFALGGPISLCHSQCVELRV